MRVCGNAAAACTCVQNVYRCVTVVKVIFPSLSSSVICVQRISAFVRVCVCCKNRWLF